MRNVLKYFAENPQIRRHSIKYFDHLPIDLVEAGISTCIEDRNGSELGSMKGCIKQGDAYLRSKKT
jgi:hypothetical protein